MIYSPKKNKSVQKVKGKIILTLLLFLAIPFSVFGAKSVPDKVAIQFRWYHQFQFAGYYAAKEKGFYSDEGLDVELRERLLSTSQVDDVLEGRAQYGVADSGLVLSRIKGKPVVLLAQIFQHSPLVFLSLKDSGIRNPFDLRGKKVMYNFKGYDDAPLTAMLSETLGNLKSLEVVPHSFNYHDLTEGKVDAISSYSTSQPHWYRENGFAVNVIDPRDYGIDFYGDNLFTSEKELLEHPQRVEKIRRATLKGWRYAINNPDEIIRLILEKYNTQKLTKAFLEYEARTTLKMIVPEIDIGSYQLSRFQKIVETYTRLGFSHSTKLDQDFFYQNIPIINLSSEEKDYLKQLGTVRVNALSNNQPLSFRGLGQPSGFANDLLVKVLESLGVRIHWQDNVSYSEALQAIKKGQLDIQSPYSQFGKPREHILATKLFHRVPFVVVGRYGSAPIKSIKDLEGKRLVLVKGFQQTITVLQQYPYLQVRLVENIDKAYEIIRSNDADFYIDHATHASYHIRQSLSSDLKICGTLPREQVGELKVHFGVSKRMPLLLSAMNKALEAITPLQMLSLKSKWIPEQNTSLITSLNAQEKSWLESHDSITMCVNPADLPFSQLSERGVFEGVIADYMAIISSRLSVPIRFYPTSSYQDSIKKVTKGDCMFLSSASVFKKDGAKQLVTKPYFVTKRVFATHKDTPYVGNFAEIASEKIGIRKNCMAGEELKKEFPDLDFVLFEDADTGLQKLDRGEIGAFVCMLGSVSYSVQKQRLTNVKIGGILPGDAPFPILVSDKYPLLVPIFNKAIDAITLGERKEIDNRWFAVKLEHGLDYTILWQVLSAFALVLGVVLISMNQMRKKNFTLLMSQSRLKRALEKAEVANRAKGIFLKTVSHELKTPLNVIMGMSYSALQSSVTPEQRNNYIEKTLNAAKDLSILIHDTLELSDIESGKLILVESDFQLDTVLKDFSKYIEMKSKDKRLEFSLHVDPDTPNLLIGDHKRLSLILSNLGDNGVKFNKTGGKIELGVEVESEKGAAVVLHFSLKDTGIGISPEKREKLFKAFIQIDDSFSRIHGGMGLGLLLSKKLTKEMGGRIWVESTPDVGSTFHFTVLFKRQDSVSRSQEVVTEDFAKDSRETLERKEQSSDVIDFDIQQAQVLLQELTAHLTAHNTEAINTAKALQTLLSQTIYADSLTQIITFLDRFDFDKAKEEAVKIAKVLGIELQ